MSTFWGELKINGTNIPARSYASLNIWNNQLLVYGGYQSQTGILSTFHSLQLDGKEFQWKHLKSIGPLMKHSGFVHADWLYLIGGQKGTSRQTNGIHKYDLRNGGWVSLGTNGSYPRPFDNHCAVQMSPSNLILQFGGFYQGVLGNTLYQLDLERNEWEVVSEGGPQPREGASLANWSDAVYLFGGTNGLNRLNDLWEFQLSGRKWRRIYYKKEQVVPRIRNGCSLNAWENKLVLFGGIYDITWELDDLWVFHIAGAEWRLVEEDSTRRKEGSESPAKKKKIKSHSPSQRVGRSTIKKSMPTQMSEAESHRTTQPKMRNFEDQKKKQFEARKADMLRQFEIPEQHKAQFRTYSPTSEQMKNCLYLLGEHYDGKKITDFGKESVSKFLEPIETRANLLPGKKPCARDGHRSVLYGDRLIIFGGDRHQMSFSDLYSIQLNSLT